MLTILQSLVQDTNLLFLKPKHRHKMQESKLKHPQEQTTKPHHSSFTLLSMILQTAST
ncbi:hypothetical protein LINPERPRIM_LOCUS35797, partial [Linum perenne]